MALPKLNSTPSYELILPSTQEKIKFRPFLVKEQKILLMAYETRDKANIIRAMIDTLESCVHDYDVRNFTTYDAEYVFTQIRAKSVGEKIELFIKCIDCAFENPVSIDLEKVEMDNQQRDKDVTITDTVTVRLRYPNYQVLLNNGIINSESNSITDMLMSMIKCSMYSIITPEENILLSDESPEEIDDFINSMTSDQFQGIADFIQNIPVLKYNLKFTCTQCSHENEHNLQGLDDFF